jgi:hypothetical protein
MVLTPWVQGGGMGPGQIFRFMERVEGNISYFYPLILMDANSNYWHGLCGVGNGYLFR